MKTYIFVVRSWLVHGSVNLLTKYRNEEKSISMYRKSLLDCIPDVFCWII